MAGPALLFDFDGLLIDSETAGLRSWQEVFTAHGRELDLGYWLAEVAAGRGPVTPVALLEDSLGYQVDWDSVEQRRRARRDELIILRPGVIGLLDRAVAAGMRIAIVSNAPDWWVNGRLASTGLDQYPFAAIITKEPGMCPKPAPDAYLAALRALDVAACEAIAFEDSPVGLAAARAAGVFCVGVPNDVTKHLSLAEADLICASLAEIVLPELLRRVMR